MSDKEKDFAAGLRAWQRTQSGLPVPQAAKQRSLERLLSGEKRKVSLWLPALAVAAVVIALFVLLRLPGTNQEEVAAHQKFLISDESGNASIVRAPSNVAVVAGTATVALPNEGLIFHRAEKLRVAHGGSHVLVSQGRARVDATKPVSFEVSAGVIATDVASFWLEESATGGSLRVISGEVTFSGFQDYKEVASEGETIAWPREIVKPTSAPRDDFAAEPKSVPRTATVTSSKTASSTAVSTTVAREVTSDQLTSDTSSLSPASVVPNLGSDAKAKRSVEERLAVMRSRGRYSQAVQLLRQALAEPHYSRRQKETYSFEIISILSRSAKPICKEVKRHRQTYATGRYAKELRTLAAGCKKSGKF